MSEGAHSALDNHFSFTLTPDIHCLTVTESVPSSRTASTVADKEHYGL